jgi:hypothetical protein
MGTELHAEGDAVGEANDIILLMLGATRQLETFFEATEARARSDAPPAPGGDDPLVAAALGLISLRRSLKRWRLHAINDCQRKQQPPVDLSAAAGVSLR